MGLHSLIQLLVADFQHQRHKRAGVTERRGCFGVMKPESDGNKSGALLFSTFQEGDALTRSPHNDPTPVTLIPDHGCHGD